MGGCMESMLSALKYQESYKHCKNVEESLIFLAVFFTQKFVNLLQILWYARKKPELLSGNGNSCKYS